MQPGNSVCSRRLTAALVALLPLAAPAAAQLVTNATFDTDVSGWNPDQSSLEWSALDAKGSAGSGSALVTNVSETPVDASGAIQCVGPIAAGTGYWVAAATRFPAGQTETGHAKLLVQFYSTPTCTTQITNIASTAVGSATEESWEPIWKMFTTPALTAAVRLRLDVLKIEAGGSLAAHFDDVELYPALFVDKFESGDTSAWSWTEPPI